MLKYLLLLIVLLAAVVSARNLDSQCDFDTSSCDPCPGLLYHYEYNEFECPISCECVHDPDMLFEGDIKLEGRSLALANKLYGISPDDDRSYGLTSNRGLFWPATNDKKTVKIPYAIDNAVHINVVEAISAAFSDFQGKTCIRFIKRENAEPDYIRFINGGGCYSSLGKQGGKQEVSLGYHGGCGAKGIVIHELMHVLGFWHEQSRPDRDNYVTINWANIKSGEAPNFDKINAVNSLGSRYDCGSVMHYGSHYFSKNGQPTISAKAGVTCNMGQRAGFSASDLYQINRAYCRCTDQDQERACERWERQGHCSKSDISSARLRAHCKVFCFGSVCST